MAGYREANRLWLEPGAARAYAAGILRYPELAFEERNLFLTLFNDQALFFQGAFALHESGQLEEETYRRYLQWFAANVATPGGQVWWEEIARPLYTSRMVSAVDARLADGNLPDLRVLHWFRLDDSPPGSPSAA